MRVRWHLIHREMVVDRTQGVGHPDEVPRGRPDAGGTARAALRPMLRGSREGGSEPEVVILDGAERFVESADRAEHVPGYGRRDEHEVALEQRQQKLIAIGGGGDRRPVREPSRCGAARVQRRRRTRTRRCRQSRRPVPTRAPSR